MSFYILALSIHPCEDSKPIIISEVSNILLENDVVYEHVVLERDICPPFCLCSCCSISLELPLVHYFPLVKYEYMDPFAEWIRHNSDHPTFDIFQPPRFISSIS